MSALAGIMIVVVLHTFKWFSLPMLCAACLTAQRRDAVVASLECCPMLSVHRKVIRSDVLIMVVVTVLVVATNIVLAVGIGLGLACASYAWQSASQLVVSASTSYRTPPGAGKPQLVKTYEVSGPLFFAATKAFGEYFTPEDDPELVICTFTGGGTLFDYTIMDGMVGLSAAYRAEGKQIQFHTLRPRSIKMLQKAEHWTKEVIYMPEQLTEHTAHTSPLEGGGDYATSHNVKRRITGLHAPSWGHTPGPGVYEIAPSGVASPTTSSSMSSPSRV
jgi:SulP family sulfate permease